MSPHSGPWCCALQQSCSRDPQLVHLLPNVSTFCLHGLYLGSLTVTSNRTHGALQGLSSFACAGEEGKQTSPSPEQRQVELTDGWYSVRATLDAGLSRMLAQEKLHIGEPPRPSFLEHVHETYISASVQCQVSITVSCGQLHTIWYVQCRNQGASMRV